MEAHGHALRKDAWSCSRALRRAETTFSQRTGRDLPAWLAYFDEAYFAAKIAHCFHALEQGKQTEKYALRSLDMDPRYIRGKAFNLALLAIGYALQGELDQACVRGREAVDLSSDLDSARAITYIRRLLSELTPHDHEDQVREFSGFSSTSRSPWIVHRVRADERGTLVTNGRYPRRIPDVHDPFLTSRHTSATIVPGYMLRRKSSSVISNYLL